jgi:hypothetical protein
MEKGSGLLRKQSDILSHVHSILPVYERGCDVDKPLTLLMASCLCPAHARSSPRSARARLEPGPAVSSACNVFFLVLPNGHFRSCFPSDLNRALRPAPTARRPPSSRQPPPSYRCLCFFTVALICALPTSKTEGDNPPGLRSTCKRPANSARRHSKCLVDSGKARRHRGSWCYCT